MYLHILLYSTKLVALLHWKLCTVQSICDSHWKCSVVGLFPRCREPHQTHTFPFHTIHHYTHTFTLCDRPTYKLCSCEADNRATCVIVFGFPYPNTFDFLIFNGCNVEHWVCAGDHYTAHFHTALMGLEGRVCDIKSISLLLRNIPAWKFFCDTVGTRKIANWFWYWAQCKA